METYPWGQKKDEKKEEKNIFAKTLSAASPLISNLFYTVQLTVNKTKELFVIPI